MKEFVEKLIGRLEEEKRLVPYNRLLDTIEDKPKEVGQLMTYQRVIEIVNQLAEEYSVTGGWIPCSERLPETNKVIKVWLSFTNDICSFVKRAIWYNNRFEYENGKVVSNTPVAWKKYNVPEPYQPKGE